MTTSKPSGPSAPQQKPSGIRLERVQSGSTIRVRLLEGQVHGCFVHYVKDRSKYCGGDECRWGCSRLEKTWKGFISCEVWNPQLKNWHPCALEVTEHLELDFRGRTRRGQVWRLSRAARIKNKHFPVVGELVDQLAAEGLRDPFDVSLVLVHIFHQWPLLLDVPNPLPPRLVAEPSQGAPPADLLGPVLEVYDPKRDGTILERSRTAAKNGRSAP